jgi:hypothetical protein
VSELDEKASKYGVTVNIKQNRSVDERGLAREMRSILGKRKSRMNVYDVANWRPIYDEVARIDDMEQGNVQTITSWR